MRVPDVLQRATLLRRAGTQKLWAPALRRNASRCTASGARNHPYFTSSHPPSANGRNACSAEMVETSL